MQEILILLTSAVLLTGIALAFYFMYVLFRNHWDVRRAVLTEFEVSGYIELWPFAMFWMSLLAWGPYSGPQFRGHVLRQRWICCFWLLSVLLGVAAGAVSDYILSGEL